MNSPENWIIGTPGFVLMGGRFRRAFLTAIDIEKKQTLWKPLNSKNKSYWLPFNYPHIDIDEKL